MFNLRVKTPIWTGNIDTKSDILQSTNIMGSIRWWFEAIIRGLDKYACDPTGYGRCPREGKDRGEKYYCPVCIVFGATGMRRMFKLIVDGGEKVFGGSSINIKPSGRNRGWYLGSGIKGEMKMNIIALDKDFDKSLILTPLIIASKWGGIGAKIQHGYGVVEIENFPEINFNEFTDAVEKITEERPSKLGIILRHENDNGLPNLKEMFFAKVQFKVTNDNWWKSVDGLGACANDQRMIEWISSGSVPIAPAIKNWLRYGNGRELWENNNKNQDKGIENFLFGTTNRVCHSCYGKVQKDRDNPQNFWCPNCRKSIKKEETFEKIASKINISCAYRVGENLWEFKIWGWIPKNDLPAEFDRDSFLDNFKQSLTGNDIKQTSTDSGSISIPWNNLLGNQTKNHELKVWREFDSLRDTVKPNENNIKNYLQSLLKGEGG
ncbi:type III-B CRISPR module RAMP protein Cmr1 [Thermoanaerobacter sp. CM-CNRG TB177]|jgi:CRISPR-associated protein Cmr1|uniref:type III-B CRISPR module RAMP protein Cmr1 n=1 Tax=Thermoanaerobacter sp. CM-CNRG TB177 TaxID=2800659 RepID=UPI001BDE2E69|nr:type III-B CRISPR module RAMP protein Cmr1 [Thermoanaerobacter sp. CM-CNRG TB177]MBT1279455.1 type III-B CRISPR module RAMP protein Cmr1 [Thermoanaerobacter sp. CM-CNRG TB177]